MDGEIDTLCDALEALRARRVSSYELVTAALEAAERHDPLLGTFLARFPDEALAAAQAADARAANLSAELPPLHGIPVGVKDVLAASEGTTTAQSPVHDPNWFAGQDGAAVYRLRRAGAILVGKTTTEEHAFGSPDPECGFPIPRNPWDPNRTPGGSSSGSASGLVGGMFLGALGTDTAGSIRSPSACCGVTGLKVTYGAVPVLGCLPLAPTLDVVGPLARSARDCAHLLRAIAGRLVEDPTTAGAPPAMGLPAWRKDLRGVRLGILREEFDGPPSPGYAAALEAALSTLAALGAELVDVVLDGFEALTTASALTVRAEAFAVHARGLASRWSEYGRGFRWRVGAGALLTAESVWRAQLVRRRATARVRVGFSGLDAVLAPTRVSGAPRLDGGGLLRTRTTFRRAWNGAGFPSLAVPIGFDEQDLPLSLQFIGLPWHEQRLLCLADCYQQATDWHRRTPVVEAPEVLVFPDPEGDPVPGGLEELSGRIGIALRRQGIHVNEEELPRLAADVADELPYFDRLEAGQECIPYGLPAPR